MELPPLRVGSPSYFRDSVVTKSVLSASLGGRHLQYWRTTKGRHRKKITYFCVPDAPAQK